MSASRQSSDWTGRWTVGSWTLGWAQHIQCMLQLHLWVVMQSAAHPKAQSKLPAATGTRWRREIAARQGLQIFLPSMGGLTNLSPLPQVLQPGACKFKR